MKLKEDMGNTIQFYKTKMVFKTTLEQTNNQYSIILMTHPSSIGPAFIHPDGPESFFVLEGNYTFTLNDKTIEATKGDFVFIPQNAPHKYKSGVTGGQVLVTTPPSVETYFLHIADKLLNGDVSLEYEFEFAKRHGQIFLETNGHWGHK
jgi:quercetin dioxygenase-like cupin family protein